MPKYKIFAEDIAAPFSHMVFYMNAQQSPRAEKLLGVKSAPSLAEIKNSYVYWCMQPDNFLRLAEAAFSHLSRPSFYQRVVKNSYKSLRKFQQAAAQLQEKKFTEFSNRQLIKVVENYLKIWEEATVWGHIVNMSDFSFNLLSNKVTELIDAKIKDKKSKFSTVEVFTILSTPIKPSFLNKKDQGLYKLLMEINRQPKLKQIFFEDKTNEIIKHLHNHDFYKKVKRFSQRFDWIEYQYLGPTILGTEYFIDLLRSMVKQGIDPRKKLHELQKETLITKNKQQRFKQRFRFSKQEMYWINMAKEFIFLKGYRKDITFYACRSMDGLLKEISQRFSLSLRQLQFMTKEEIFRSLSSNKLQLSVDTINQRIKYCLVYNTRSWTKVYIGQEAKKLAKQIILDEVLASVNQLKGTSAFPGKVRGVVKLVLTPDDMSKMNKGDILVSSATNPNMMPALNKAAGIVTNEGGVTCHAAIVARELKKPCVIGTRIATKVLKDGDKVIVDATNGLVKII